MGVPGLVRLDAQDAEEEKERGKQKNKLELEGASGVEGGKGEEEEEGGKGEWEAAGEGCSPAAGEPGGGQAEQRLRGRL